MVIAFVVIALAVVLFGLNEFRVMERDKKNGYKFLHTNPDDKTRLGSSSQTSEPVVVSSV